MRSRANWSPASTRWRSMRRRRRKGSAEAKPSRGSRSGRLRRRFLHHRRDPQRLETVAIPPQHLEAEAVEGEALARFGDRARLVNDEPGDGGGFLVRQVPIHRAVEVADRHRAVDIDRAVGLRAYARDLDVVFVGDVADDFLEDVL